MVLSDMRFCLVAENARYSNEYGQDKQQAGDNKGKDPLQSNDVTGRQLCKRKCCVPLALMKTIGNLGLTQ